MKKRRINLVSDRGIPVRYATAWRYGLWPRPSGDDFDKEQVHP